MSFIKATKKVFSGRAFGFGHQMLYNNFASLKESNINKFEYAVYMIPHPQKVKKGGEDAYFVHSNVLAVADGVGGWAEVGVDPALYARELCKNVGDLVTSNWNLYKGNPKQLLIDAAGRTKSEGSSTLVITNLDEEKPVLHTAYIGDAGYMIIRKEGGRVKLVYQSPEQQREFNFPYQIGTYGDPPQIAANHKHDILNNDIVVAGSDGLFDNLDDQQIIDTVKPFLQVGDTLPDVPLVAEMIAQLAYKCSLDMKYNSPFAKRAKAAFLDYRGGKSDDITVAVGQVKLASNVKK